MRHLRRGLAALIVVATGCSSSEPPRARTSASDSIATPSVAARTTMSPTTSEPSPTAAPPTTEPPTTEPPTTEAPPTEPTTTLVPLAADQQPETVDEIRALLTAVPVTGEPDPEASSIDASVAGALARVADGTLSAADYFLAAGDFLPDGVVINSYLMCPMSIGENCRASRGDYQRYIDERCRGRPVIVSTVEGVLGPVGAGTCVWRPTPDELEAAGEVVDVALANVVPAHTGGHLDVSDAATVAADAYAQFSARHPFEDPLRSNVDGAGDVRAALAPFYGLGYLCSRTWFADPIVDRNAALTDVSDRVRQGIDGPVGATADSQAGRGVAVGSGRVYVAWCVAGVA